MSGRTIALYGDTGSGKTTQTGEYAKHKRKTTGKNTLLISSDMGGYDSIGALVRAGVVIPVELGPKDDPWIWIDEAVNGSLLTDEIGLVVYDSATSQGEALLSACSHSEFQIGQQKTQRFSVSRGARALSVSLNNEAHYGLVQGFLLDAIWRSTFLTRGTDLDVIWTFSVHRGEEQDRTPILGPKLAGKALTAAIPKWFKYTFRLASVPQDGAAPRHLLYLTEYPELNGLGHSFGNARFPLGINLDLPAFLEPASLVEALDLIDRAQKEADELLKAELGL